MWNFIWGILLLISTSFAGSVLSLLLVYVIFGKRLIRQLKYQKGDDYGSSERSEARPESE